MSAPTGTGRSTRSLTGTAAMLLATIGMLAVVWAVFSLLAEPFFGSSASLVAGVVALALGATIVGGAVRMDWSLTPAVAGYLLLLSVLTACFLGAVWGIIYLPTMLFAGGRVGILVAGGISLSLASVFTVALVIAVARLGSNIDWSLTSRMVASVLLLAMLTIGFVAVLWLAFFALSWLFLPTWVAVIGAVAVTVAVLGLVGYVEYAGVDMIEDQVDADPVDPEAIPELHAMTTRVASVLDVPVPTIAISRRRTPEAMVVGLRAESTHLVLSQGTLRALDDDELEAVIAHELAHVANNDAMVITAVSAPIVLADGLRARLEGDEPWIRRGGSDESDEEFWSDGDELTDEELYGPDGEWRMYPESDDEDDENEDHILVAISTATAAVGRVVVAVFSRARETAADRTAVEVTGSPADLASALRTLDDRIDRTLDRDLRKAAGVSSLSILPVDPDEVEPITLGPDGEIESPHLSHREPFVRIRNRLLRTHPPTERRLDALAALEHESD